MMLVALVACAVAVGAARPQEPAVSPARTPPPLAMPPPPPPPHTTTAPGDKTTPPAAAGPVCECGYTYCASVLMNMDKPWKAEQLAEAYCKTPKAGCANGRPGTDVREALFLCLCGGADQRVGDELHLLCGCDKCLVVGPDYRGRCEAPCRAGCKWGML